MSWLFPVNKQKKRASYHYSPTFSTTWISSPESTSSSISVHRCRRRRFYSTRSDTFPVPFLFVFCVSVLPILLQLGLEEHFSICQAFTLLPSVVRPNLFHIETNFKRSNGRRDMSAFSSTKSEMNEERKLQQLTSASETASSRDMNQNANWRIYPKFANQNDVTTAQRSPFARNAKTPSWSRDVFQSSLSLHESLISCADSYISPELEDSLHSLGNAYRLYGPENVVGSFNGGKDAVVILELIRAAHAKYYHDLLGGNTDDANIIRPRVIYFYNSQEFPQVLQFVQDTVKNYDLDMVAFEEGVGFKDGLDILVRTNYYNDAGLVSSDKIQPQIKQERPHPMAFVLGTRTSDPNAGRQGIFAPSSSYMPPFMRVNPILKWSYGKVWHFLRLYKLPYCSLYDQGYTSLGNILDTFPCPSLKKVSVNSVEKGVDTTVNNIISEEEKDETVPSSMKNGVVESEYWPAYMLKDWDQERAGRIKLDKKKMPSVVPSTMSQASSTISLSTTSLKNNSAAATNAVNNQKDGIPSAVQVGSSGTEPSTELSSSDNRVSFQPMQNIETASPSSSVVSSDSQRTVGLIIIGDEILKGMTVDTNTHAAASALRSYNVPLSRTVVVSDNQSEIMKEIRSMEEAGVDVIVTSGGVGPTHDDVTIHSISAALGSEMVFHEGMATLLRKMMKKNENNDDDGDDFELNEAQTKMATLPSCAKLRYLSNVQDDWPILQCKNIFVLPGIPQFFEKKIKLVASYLSTELERSATFKVVLSIDENSIVPILNKVVDNHRNVSFGSYPFVDHPDYKTVVTLEGRTFEGGHSRNSGKFLTPPIQLDSEDEGESINNDFDSPPKDVIFGKDQMNLYVKLALSDLVNRMPEGSVLRVDNDDNLNFS